MGHITLMIAIVNLRKRGSANRPTEPSQVTTYFAELSFLIFRTSIYFSLFKMIKL